MAVRAVQAEQAMNPVKVEPESWFSDAEFELPPRLLADNFQEPILQGIVPGSIENDRIYSVGEVGYDIITGDSVDFDSTPLHTGSFDSLPASETMGQRPVNGRPDIRSGSDVNGRVRQFIGSIIRRQNSSALMTEDGKVSDDTLYTQEMGQYTDLVNKLRRMGGTIILDGIEPSTNDQSFWIGGELFYGTYNKNLATAINGEKGLPFRKNRRVIPRSPINDIKFIWRGDLEITDNMVFLGKPPAMKIFDSKKEVIELPIPFEQLVDKKDIDRQAERTKDWLNKCLTAGLLQYKETISSGDRQLRKLRAKLGAAALAGSGIGWLAQNYILEGRTGLSMVIGSCSTALGSLAAGLYYSMHDTENEVISRADELSEDRRAVVKALNGVNPNTLMDLYRGTTLDKLEIPHQPRTEAIPMNGRVSR